MTPLLTHAFQVLYDWHRAGAGDAIPWQKIKDGETDVLPVPTLQAAAGSSSIQIQNSPTPGVPVQPAVVTVTPPTLPVPQTTPAVATVESKSVEVVEAESDEDEQPTKGKGKMQEATTGLSSKDKKRRKVSPEFVPVQHLEDEEPAPPSKRRKPDFARMTATPTPIEPDRLWKSLTERPTPMCESCVTKGHGVCHTTALQIACMPCHAGKTKCSYTTPRIARLKELQESGEIEPPKSGRRAPAKGNAKGKKKRQGEETTVEDSAAEYVPPGTIDGPSINPTIPVPLADAVQASSPACPPTSTSHVAAEPPQNMRVPTIAGLQREVGDLKHIVNQMSGNHESLYQDNVKLRESVDALLGWKEKIMVSVPALEAEMRGLRNGMEWEKIRQEMASLRSELANTKERLATYEGDTTTEDEDNDDLPPLEINVPKSSMYVDPRQMRVSIRSNSAAARSSNPGNHNDVEPVEMAVDTPVQLPSAPVNASIGTTLSSATNTCDESSTTTAAT